MACGLHMCRVEVEAPDFGLRTSRGNRHSGNPIPTPEIGVAKGPAQIRWSMAHQESGHRQPGGGRLPIKGVRVTDISYVTIVPAGHGKRALPLFHVFDRGSGADGHARSWLQGLGNAQNPTPADHVPPVNRREPGHGGAPDRAEAILSVFFTHEGPYRPGDRSLYSGSIAKPRPSGRGSTMAGMGQMLEQCPVSHAQTGLSARSRWGSAIYAALWVCRKSLHFARGTNADRSQPKLAAFDPGPWLERKNIKGLDW